MFAFRSSGTWEWGYYSNTHTTPDNYYSYPVSFSDWELFVVIGLKLRLFVHWQGGSRPVRWWLVTSVALPVGPAGEGCVARRGSGLRDPPPHPLVLLRWWESTWGRTGRWWTAVWESRRKRFWEEWSRTDQASRETDWSTDGRVIYRHTDGWGVVRQMDRQTDRWRVREYPLWK